MCVLQQTPCQCLREKIPGPNQWTGCERGSTWRWGCSQADDQGREGQQQQKWQTWPVHQIAYLLYIHPWSSTWHLKRYQHPKRKPDHLPSIIFQGRTVNFRWRLGDLGDKCCPWIPRPWKTKVSIPKVWIIPRKHDGCGFPWYPVIFRDYFRSHELSWSRIMNQPAMKMDKLMRWNTCICFFGSNRK